jgi:hypothetical protein
MARDVTIWQHPAKSEVIVTSRWTDTQLPCGKEIVMPSHEIVAFLAGFVTADDSIHFRVAVYRGES